MAEADLEAIWLYSFQTWSLEQAEEHHGLLVAAFEGLASGAKIGRSVDLREGYFKYPAGSHLVFYKHAEPEIHIIRVLHQSMDVDAHL